MEVPEKLTTALETHRGALLAIDDVHGIDVGIDPKSPSHREPVLRVTVDDPDHLSPAARSLIDTLPGPVRLLKGTVRLDQK